MDVVEAVRLRRSVRGFKRDMVPKEVLGEIFEIASCSPSTMNTQPCEITVIAGHALEDIKRSNIETLDSGATPKAEVSFPPFKGKYRERQVELAVEIFRLMGIAREDRDKRANWMQRGFRFFDAPVGIILTMDKSLDESSLSLLDIGVFAQTICLVALDYRLATCIEDQAVMFPEVIRRVTGIPESQRIIIAIAMGYPDMDFPANKLKSRREPVEKIVTWCGFD